MCIGGNGVKVAGCDGRQGKPEMRERRVSVRGSRSHAQFFFNGLQFSPWRSIGHEVEEVFEVHNIWLALVGFLDHYVDFLLRQVYFEFFGELFEVVQIYISLVSLVKEIEDIFDFLLIVLLYKEALDFGDELPEIDLLWFVCIKLLKQAVKELVYGEVLCIVPKLLDADLKLVDVDLLVVVGVEQIERLLYFCDFFKS